MSDAGGGNGKEQVSTLLAPEISTYVVTVDADPLVTLGAVEGGVESRTSNVLDREFLYYTDESGNHSSSPPYANRNFKKWDELTKQDVITTTATTQTVTTQAQKTDQTHELVTQTTTYEEIDPGKSQPVNQAKEDAADPDTTATLSDDVIGSNTYAIGTPTQTVVELAPQTTTLSETYTAIDMTNCNNGNDYCTK